MMRRYNRLLVAFYVVSDALLGDGRVRARLPPALRRRSPTSFPITKGVPAVRAVPATCCRSSALLVPLAFHMQGLYRLRRGRSRVDDFFAVFVGSILAVVLGVVGTLVLPDLLRCPSELKDAGVYEVSQLGLGAVPRRSTSLFTYASRELVREALERRWRAGIGLKRVLIAGAGDLGRMVADKVLEHRELGFKVVGFLDDRAAAITSATAACRCSARSATPTRSSAASASITSTSRCRSKST